MTTCDVFSNASPKSTLFLHVLTLTTLVVILRASAQLDRPVIRAVFFADDFSQRKSRLTRSFSIRVGRVREDVI